MTDSPVKMVGFRHSLVHDCGNLHRGFVEDVLQKRLADLDRLADLIQTAS